MCRNSRNSGSIAILHLLENLLLQQASFFFNHRQLTELQNRAVDPIVAFRQLTASEVSERTLQVTSFTAWESVGASNEEAVGSCPPDHLTAFMLVVSSKHFHFSLGPVGRSITYVETKNIPNTGGSEPAERGGACETAAWMVTALSCSTADSQHSGPSKRHSTPGKVQLQVQTRDKQQPKTMTIRIAQKNGHWIVLSKKRSGNPHRGWMLTQRMD